MREQLISSLQTHEEKQFVLNVGVIEGGIGPNTVAEYAKCVIDTRFLRVEDYKDSKKAIEQIALECSTPHTRATLHIDSS